MPKDFWTRDDEESGEGIGVSFRKDSKKQVSAIIFTFGGNTLEMLPETFEKAVRDYALAKAGVK